MQFVEKLQGSHKIFTVILGFLSVCYMPRKMPEIQYLHLTHNILLVHITVEVDRDALEELPGNPYYFCDFNSNNTLLKLIHPFANPIILRRQQRLS